MPDGVVPVPPDRIRPGQLGVVMLGRVIIGDIATTLVDLAVRGMLAVEEEEQHGQGGWLLGAGGTGLASSLPGGASPQISRLIWTIGPRTGPGELAR
jgi:hypothetical protein